MPKSSYFRTHFESQRVHGHYTLLTRSWQHSYQNFPLMQNALSWKRSLLVRSEILRLFGNTLSSYHMYSRRQMKKICATGSTAIISKTENIFSNLYCTFGMCTKFFGFRIKRSTLQLKYFGSQCLREMWLLECWKAPISEHNSRLNVFTCIKLC